MRKVSKRDQAKKTTEQLTEEVATATQEVSSLIAQVERAVTRPIVAEPPKVDMDTYRCYIPAGDNSCIWYEITCETYDINSKGTVFYNLLEDGYRDVLGFCPLTWGWRKK